MTALAMPLTGAPSTRLTAWPDIDWTQVEKHVKRLQMRIAKAAKAGRHGKVKALQWLLTHSFYGKLLAVKRITQNKGRNTPGIDRVVLNTNKKKMQTALELKRRGYTSKPLRRIYIPKKNGKRPLGIPTMKDRAMQSLHLQALEPVAEIRADRHSYGFRSKRSTADAIEQCHALFTRRGAPQWLLEGDIKSCFDQISHKWLLKHIPMDQKTLRTWLKAGFIEKQVLFPTNEGTPQGGIISPTLANMTLDGLEMLFATRAFQHDKVNVVRYADDFIITGDSKEVLKRKVKPLLEAFLRHRGLELSQEKTKITRITEGFDFLGFNVRKFNNGKVLTKPSKKSTLAFLQRTKELIKIQTGTETALLIQQLNPKIRGWCNYYRCSSAKKIFSYVDHRIFHALLKWAKRRHSNKGRKWIVEKYFCTQGLRQWVFFDTIKNEEGNKTKIKLFSALTTPIKRHTKIKGEATPFDDSYKKYFEQRKALSKSNTGKLKILPALYIFSSQTNTTKLLGRFFGLKDA